MSTVNGQTSLKAFCFALSLFIVLLLFSSSCFFRLLISFLHLVAASLFFYFRCSTKHAFHVALIALFLGYVFVVGLFLALISADDVGFSSFGFYLCLLSFFHYSEYYSISIVNPKSLSLDSFLINHSHSYTIGILSTCLEFFVEKYFFPDMKDICWLQWIGLLLCVVGEAIRKAAMFTARSGFNHVIQIRREEGHVLVTHGIYALFRHPAYVGYYYLCIGTQLLLANPICLVGLNVASWTFFNSRIQDEEITLLNFFGEDYVRYQNRVPTGLPFIKGYRLEM